MFEIILTSSISLDDKSKKFKFNEPNTSKLLSVSNSFADKSIEVTFLKVSRPVKSEIPLFDKFNDVTLSIADCSNFIVRCASLNSAVIPKATKLFFIAWYSSPFNVSSTLLFASAFANEKGTM